MACKDTQPILVVGAGAWGTALAIHLASNHNQVHLWGHDANAMHQMERDRCNASCLPGVPFPPNLMVFDDLAIAAQAVQDILLVVPSFAFVSVLQQLNTLCLSSVRIAWGTKGLDPKTGGFLHEAISRVMGKTTPAAIISGPSFAREVGLKVPTAVCIAGNNDAFVDDMTQRFHAPHFRVYPNADMVGVQLCGVMKNILAIASGLTVGLSLGANTRAALLTRGIAEMSRLMQACGGQQSTLMGLSGMGDLILTCMDDQSRNRRFGTALGEGVYIEDAKAQVGGEVEGLQNTRQLYEISVSHGIDLPITRQVYRVLYEGLSPQQGVAELMQRDRASSE